jgi:putative hydrolase of the HAD superfamily
MRETNLTRLKYPKGILFDYWGTLVNWKPNRESGINGLLDMIPDRKDVTFKMIKDTADELMTAVNDVKLTSLMEFTRAQFDKNLFDRLGISINVNDDELDFMYLKNYHLSSCEPGVIEMLTAVKQKGIKTGVVSNASAGGFAHSKLLEELGILEYIDFVMTSADYGFRKPHPQLFKTALAKLSTKAEETWFVGDTLTDDISGSTDAGIMPIWYNPKEKPNESDLNPLEIRGWDEFVKLLKELE